MFFSLYWFISYRAFCFPLKLFAHPSFLERWKKRNIGKSKFNRESEDTSSGCSCIMNCVTLESSFSALMCLKWGRDVQVPWTRNCSFFDPLPIYSGVIDFCNLTFRWANHTDSWQESDRVKVLHSWLKTAGH